ncbi:MAG: DUF998 domain-containing protein [Dehalococcoidales bacterium]|nr:DUF998 domain-containing protein [Dehalococcoidales bacterium]
MLALDVVQSSPNLVIKTISDLVHGSYGWLQSLSFVLLAFWFFIFIFKLFSITGKRIGSLTGTSFLSVTSFGFILIAVFPSQASGLGQTLQGLVHNSIAGLISSSFIIGCIAFAVHFKRDPQWMRYWIYTTVTVISCLAFALLWALIPPEWALKGLAERLVLITGFTWVAVISLKLVRLCRQSREAVRIEL